MCIYIIYISRNEKLETRKVCVHQQRNVHAQSTVQLLAMNSLNASSLILKEIALILSERGSAELSWATGGIFKSEKISQRANKHTNFSLI